MAIHATPEAEDSIERFLRAINENLEEALRVLTTEGRYLSDPNHWGGGKAETWRDNFDRVENGSRQLQNELREIQNNARTIVQAIKEAGGGYGSSGAA